MRTNRRFGFTPTLGWGIIVILAVAAFALLNGCGGGSDSPVAATTTPTTGASSSVTTNTPAPEPTPAVTEDDPCEGDASCGKGITAKFLRPGLELEVTSTNTGHDNAGVVCATDGFQGPGLPGTPYPWSVKAESTSVTPFPLDAVEAALEWPEDPEVCEQTINVQLDAYRGEQCSGKILAVVWPQDNPMTFTRAPGEWVWSKEARTLEEDWSDCMGREEAASVLGIQYDAVAPDLPVTASDVRPETPQECVRYRKVTVSQTATRTCSVDTQSRSRSFYEWERCECPCKVPAALETSLDHNRNDIWTAATVEGEGSWELKIFATNRPGEYPDNPDWTKRITRLTLDCEEVPGPETMRATFRWRNHGAPYWWAALYVDGQRVWLSRRVRK